MIRRRTIPLLASIAVLAAAPRAQELLVNGDAETGDLTGWTDPIGNGFAVWPDGPTVPAQQGAWSFHGGTIGPAGPLAHEVRQDVDVSAQAPLVDAGLAVATFSAWGLTAEDSGWVDSAQVVLEFRDGAAAVLAVFDSGVLQPYNTWVPTGDVRTVPAGTRTLRVRLIASRQIGVSTDAFFDSLSLVLSPPAVPTAYCTAKASSAGCLAAIGTSDPGAHPVSGAGGYSVSATGVHTFKNGLLLAGLNGPATIPFGGGTLCVTPPNKRGPIRFSGGSGVDLCDGSFSTEVNTGAVIPAGLDAGAGNSAWYQYWARDPANGPGSFGTLLSDAIQLDYQ